MPSYVTELIGGAAATLTTLCWLPQTIRIIRTRDAKAISLVTQLAFGAGIALWFVYGVMIMSWPVIAANGLTFVLVCAIIVLKLMHR